MNTIIDKILHNIESKININGHIVVSNSPFDQTKTYHELYIMPKLDFVTIATLKTWISSSNDYMDFQLEYGDVTYPLVHLEYRAPGNAWTELLGQLSECFANE